MVMVNLFSIFPFSYIFYSSVKGRERERDRENGKRERRKARERDKKKMERGCLKSFNSL